MDYNNEIPTFALHFICAHCVAHHCGPHWFENVLVHVFVFYLPAPRKTLLEWTSSQDLVKLAARCRVVHGSIFVRRARLPVVVATGMAHHEVPQAPLVRLRSVLLHAVRTQPVWHVVRGGDDYGGVLSGVQEMVVVGTAPCSRINGAVGSNVDRVPDRIPSYGHRGVHGGVEKCALYAQGRHQHGE